MYQFLEYLCRRLQWLKPRPKTTALGSQGTLRAISNSSMASKHCLIDGSCWIQVVALRTFVVALRLTDYYLSRSQPL